MSFTGQVMELHTSDDSNITTNDSAKLSGEQRTTQEIGVCFLVLFVLMATAIIGNLAVIYAIYYSETLRNQVCNTFVINLSITDLSCALVVMGSALIMLAFDLRDVDTIWCNLTCAANYVFIIVSMVTLAFISIDRCVAIVSPLHYESYMTRKLVLVLIFYAWLQGIVFASVPASLHWVTYDYWEVICAIDWHYEKKQAVYYVIVACVVCFLVPAVIISYSYYRIIREAHHKKQQAKNMGPQQPAISKSMNKTIKSLLIIVIIFFTCMTPFCITKLLKVVLAQSTMVPGYVNLASAYFQYLSSVVNPFIYGIFRQDFQKAYKLLWWKLTPDNRSRNMVVAEQSCNSKEIISAVEME